MSVRDRCRDYLRRKVFRLINTSDDAVNNNAEALEHYTYNAFIRWAKMKHVPLNWECPRTRSLYTQRIMSIAFNIMHPHNSAVLDKLVDGSLTYSRLVESRPEHLYPELWTDALESVAMQRLKKEAASIDASTAPDGAFVCGRCKSKKTTYYQMQTRSADEPMTNFVSCLSCGNRWKTC